MITSVPDVGKSGFEMQPSALAAVRLKMHLSYVAPTLAWMPQKCLQMLLISSSSLPFENRPHSAALSDVPGNNSLLLGD